MLRKLTAGAVAALIALSAVAPLQAQQARPESGPEAGQKAAPDTAQGANQPPPQGARSERPPEDAAELEEQSRKAYADGKYLPFYIANLKLHKMRPHVPQYMINLVRASALLEKTNTAYHYMHMMQQQGLSFDFNSTDDTLSIRGTQAYDYINNMMIEADAPAGEGTVAVTLPGPPRDYAALAWDPSRERLLVGTIREGKLLAVAADGSTETLLQAGDDNGLWSITGLAVDAARERLWISSAASPAFDAFSAADQNRSALFEFDLGTLELLGHSYVPVDALQHRLGSVAVTGDGEVYVIDTATPIVYRKVPGKDRLEAFVASEQLAGFSDLAVTPDNSRLFAADPVMGVFLVDPKAQQAAMLGGPDNLNLAGIGGIAYADGQLFTVQGGIAPQRLMRLGLDATGVAVAEVSPMAVALEPFDGPRLATIRGGDLYYFANQGAASAEAGAIIMRTALDAGSSIQPPNLEQLERALQPHTE
jgi:DNA-binding beta-propeller fold protein YncE